MYKCNVLCSRCNMCLAVFFLLFHIMLFLVRSFNAPITLFKFCDVMFHDTVNVINSLKLYYLSRSALMYLRCNIYSDVYF